MISSLFWLIRKVLVIAPGVILGVWGYSYLKLCCLYLLDPHKPIVATYKAVGGNVKISASSYLIDLSSGRVYVRGLKVVAPAGGVIAAAKLVTVSNLHLERGLGQVFFVDVYRVTGSLVRLGNGQFELTQLLPPSQKSTSDTRFRVAVHEADIELVDLEGDLWRQRAITHELKIYGQGSNWVARGRAELPGMGFVAATVENAPGIGLEIDGRTQRLDGTKAAKHFLGDPRLKISPEYRKISFSEAVASGPFHILISNSKKVSFLGSVEGTAKNIDYLQYHLDQASFRGQLGTFGIVGKGEASLGRNRADLIGTASWKNGFSAGVHFQAAVESRANLPKYVLKLIPAAIEFRNASASGWVDYRKDLPISGQANFSVGHVSYRSDQAKDLSGSVFVKASKARVDLKQIHVAGASPTASAWIDLKTKAISGYAEGNRLALADIARLTGTSGVSGTGSVQALISGTLDKPELRFSALGRADYVNGRYHFGPDQVQLAGTYLANKLLIRRGYLNGADGLLAVSGSSSVTGNHLNLDVEARGIHPGRLVPKLNGVGSLSAKVTGSYEEPLATGILRAQDLTYQDQEIPAAVANFVADRKQISLQKVQAISGTASLEGAGSYSYLSQKVAGYFSLDGLELAQFLGDKAAGILNVPTINVTGTLKKPLIVARVDGSNLIFGDVLVDSFEALATGNPTAVTLDHATANLAGGSVSTTGTYNISSSTGSLVASSTSFDLEKLAPFLGEQISFKGSASITEAKVTYQKKSFNASAKGKLENVTANGAPAGDGNWSLNLNGDEASGLLSIGQLEPEVRVVDVSAKYNLKEKNLEGTFEADNARLRDILGASLRYVPNLSPKDEQELLSTSADLTLGATFKGPVKSPDVSIDTLQLSHILYKQQSFGDLTAVHIVRKGRVWTVPQVSVKGPEGSLSLSGTVDEADQISVSAQGSDLNARSLSTFLPGLSNSYAVANFSAKASGRTKSPDVSASLNVTHLAKAPAVQGKDEPQQDLAVDLSKISLSQGHLVVDGGYSYGGFKGTLSADAPFTYDSGFGKGTLNAKVNLEQRDIKTIDLINQFADPTRSSGMVSGLIELHGPLDNLVASGGFALTAPNLGVQFSSNSYVKKIDDDFKNVLAKISITGGKTIDLTASADEARGGSLSLNLSTPLPNLGEILKGDTGSVTSTMMNSPFAGQFAAKAFTFRQTAPGGFIAGQIDGKVDLSGSANKPEIGTRQDPGKFLLSKVDSSLPTLPKTEGTGSFSSLNPSFNLSASLVDPAHVSSATADLYLTGSAGIRGTLADPIGDSALVVSRGTVRLPGGTVRLDQGGTINLGYRRSFAQENGATLDVDLEGHTSITAIRYGQNTQRYNITLDITGNPLIDNGLHFNAISDPPDLSSDDVLALLGQKNLVESLGSTDQNDAERRVRDALVGFALPSLTDTYTSSLAHSLGLDYISLEYNSVDLATFDVARAVSPDFTLSYRQQVGSPTPGYRPIYDFRVIYSPKKGPGLLRRLSLSAGFDQDRPWKAALEYGTRFGGNTGPLLKNKTVISSPTKP